MKMLKCIDCEATFDEPEFVLFKRGHIGNGSENWTQDEYVEVCPVCGSDLFYEGYFCDECEKEVEELDELDDYGLCTVCAQKVEEADKNAIAEAHKAGVGINCTEIVRKPYLIIKG